MTTQQQENLSNGWVNGIIPTCEKCGEKFADDGHNYNERDGDEICDDCDKQIEDTNDDCSKCGIILTDEDMDRENGKCENCWFIWDGEEEEKKDWYDNDNGSDPR